MTTKDMKDINIQFEAGTSRSGSHGVNFMMPIPRSVDLYAEIPVPDGASEDYGYLALKQEILRHADAQGIDPDRLHFPYDGQEDKLAPDADGTVRNVWYAVMRDRTDDWGTGSRDMFAAITMAKTLRDDYPDTLIAIIDDSGSNPVCIDEITEF